ncbi:MAG: mechanosensitive ion channel family protein [Candidatus Pacebacteria bacterium]|nr:mechanosensitive ion channel family protein [Candidatus Paceibacterota bacterium]
MSSFDLLNVVTESAWWQYVVLGNTVGDYILSLGAFVVFLAVFKVFQVIILRRLGLLAEKTKTDIDDTLIKIVKSLRPPFYSFLAIYVAVQFLILSETLQKVFNILLIVWLVYQVIIAIQILIEYIFTKTQKNSDDNSTQGAFDMIKNIIKGALWVGGLLLILSNLGIDITALIAGLGIGGIAIALALQNILGDLFSSFAILFDKPFQVGDFIVVGDKRGTVQKIGIKTTRIKSTQGEEIVISNKEMTSVQLQNFKKMDERRISFKFGVTYETSSEKLRSIPQTVKNIVGSIENARFDRSHFIAFDDFALTFETIYYVTTNDYAVYRNVQQEINFKIKELFEKDDIDMAYPTQTVYLQKET